MGNIAMQDLALSFWSKDHGQGMPRLGFEAKPGLRSMQDFIGRGGE